MKKTNRSGTQLYSVRFEAFDLHLNDSIKPIGIWQYPIHFDFLPAFRLSKILRFPPLTPRYSNNSCGKNSTYLEVINVNRSSHFCSCHSGFYGTYCKSYDEKCNNYCAPNSICKPRYRGIITGNQDPFCLCPASTFGNTCYIKHDKCQQNPCLNGGTCVTVYDTHTMNRYICVCTDLYEGEHCQHPRGMVVLTFVSSSNSILQTNNVAATTISFNDYHNKSLDFSVRHRQVYNTIPSHLTLIYNQKYSTNAPSLAIMKVYGLNYHSEGPKYYVFLYFYECKSDQKNNIDV